MGAAREQAEANLYSQQGTQTGPFGTRTNQVRMVTGPDGKPIPVMDTQVAFDPATQGLVSGANDLASMAGQNLMGGFQGLGQDYENLVMSGLDRFRRRQDAVNRGKGLGTGAQNLNMATNKSITDALIRNRLQGAQTMHGMNLANYQAGINARGALGSQLTGSLPGQTGMSVNPSVAANAQIAGHNSQMNAFNWQQRQPNLMDALKMAGRGAAALYTGGLSEIANNAAKPDWW